MSEVPDTLQDRTCVRATAATAVSYPQERRLTLKPRRQNVGLREILELISVGYRNAEIAAKLFLSARTVDHHVPVG